MRPHSCQAFILEASGIFRVREGGGNSGSLCRSLPREECPGDLWLWRPLSSGQWQVCPHTGFRITGSGPGTALRLGSQRSWGPSWGCPRAPGRQDEDKWEQYHLSSAQRAIPRALWAGRFRETSWRRKHWARYCIGGWNSGAGGRKGTNEVWEVGSCQVSSEGMWGHPWQCWLGRLRC